MKHEITAQRLQIALNNLKMLPVELSERSGVSQASISQYLNGSHAPSNISSGKMAAVLGCSPVWLMGFDVPDPASSPIPPAEMAHLEKYRALDAEDQDTVDALTENLLAKSKYHTEEDSGQTGAA